MAASEQPTNSAPAERLGDDRHSLADEAESALAAARARDLDAGEPPVLGQPVRRRSTRSAFVQAFVGELFVAAFVIIVTGRTTGSGCTDTTILAVLALPVLTSLNGILYGWSDPNPSPVVRITFQDFGLRFAIGGRFWVGVSGVAIAVALPFLLLVVPPTVASDALIIGGVGLAAGFFAGLLWFAPGHLLGRLVRRARSAHATELAPAVARGGYASRVAGVTLLVIVEVIAIFLFMAIVGFSC
jgi:hypothetical protein